MLYNGTVHGRPHAAGREEGGAGGGPCRSDRAQQDLTLHRGLPCALRPWQRLGAQIQPHRPRTSSILTASQPALPSVPYSPLLGRHSGLWLWPFLLSGGTCVLRSPRHPCPTVRDSHYVWPLETGTRSLCLELKSTCGRPEPGPLHIWDQKRWCKPEAGLDFPRFTAPLSACGFGYRSQFPW